MVPTAGDCRRPISWPAIGVGAMPGDDAPPHFPGRRPVCCSPRPAVTLCARRRERPSTEEPLPRHARGHAGPRPADRALLRLRLRRRHGHRLRARALPVPPRGGGRCAGALPRAQLERRARHGRARAARAALGQQAERGARGAAARPLLSRLFVRAAGGSPVYRGCSPRRDAAATAGPPPWARRPSPPMPPWARPASRPTPAAITPLRAACARGASRSPRPTSSTPCTTTSKRSATGWSRATASRFAGGTSW